MVLVVRERFRFGTSNLINLNLHPPSLTKLAILTPNNPTSKMADSIPLQIAETIQTATIKRDPSPTHDLNPSTAASSKQPVSIAPPSSDSSQKFTYDDYGGLDEEGEEEYDDEDIPYSVIKPVPRRSSFGPLPDLRFEQSYLASIAGAETKGRIAWITVRDQVLIITIIRFDYPQNAQADMD